MYKVYFVSENKDEVEQVKNFIDNQIEYYGYYTYELFPVRAAKKILTKYSTKECPFAAILKDKKVIRTFYSQSEDVINSLYEYLIDNRIIEK